MRIAKLLVMFLVFAVNPSDVAIAQEDSLLEGFDAAIVKLREQAKAKKQEIDLVFTQEVARLKKELIAELETQRVEAMKADKLDDAVRIKNLKNEVVNMKV